MLSFSGFDQKYSFNADLSNNLNFFVQSEIWYID